MSSNLLVYSHKGGRGTSITICNVHHKKYLYCTNHCLTEITKSEFERLNYDKSVSYLACLGVYRRFIETTKCEYSYYIFVKEHLHILEFEKTVFYNIISIDVLDSNGEVVKDGFFDDVSKLFNGKTFYYALHNFEAFDLTQSYSSKNLISQTKADSFYNCQSNMRYFWNRSLVAFPQIMSVDLKSFFVFVINGFIDKTSYFVESGTYHCLIFSKASVLRTGVRFISRGVDDSGETSNFVETEFIVSSKDSSKVFSFKILRGSIPLFWGQYGFQIGSHDFTYTRPVELSKFALERHFSRLKESFEHIMIISLLNEKERGLTENYRKLVASSKYNASIPFIDYNYHANYNSRQKNIDPLLEMIDAQKNSAGIEYSYTNENDSSKNQKQNMIFRVNCVDCLDRTNSCETEIFLNRILPKIVEETNIVIPASNDQIRNLWIKNGNRISQYYAGTGAMGGTNSKIVDLCTSSKRVVQNNFLDLNKQRSLLGLLREMPYIQASNSFPAEQYIPKYLHNLPVLVQNEFLNNFNKFVDYYDIRLSCATWNFGSFLDLWTKIDTIKLLFQQEENFPEGLDIFVLGLQEMIPLNADNIRKDDKEAEVKTVWVDVLKSCLNETIVTKDTFICLHSKQLVGLCVFVFVRQRLLPLITEVETSILRTGAKGTVGNKGSTAIKFKIADTSMCFINSHFRSDSGNIQCRIDDYNETARNLSFQFGRLAINHDHVFWFGDFNFRVDHPELTTPDQIIKTLAEEGIERIYKYDELNIHRMEGTVFPGFNEQVINFKPTFKFCNNDYLTNRIPSWCDRILWYSTQHVFDTQNEKGETILASDVEPVEKDVTLVEPIIYDCAEIPISDHKPVYGVFDVKIRAINREKQTAIFSEILNRIGPLDGKVNIEHEELSDGKINSLVSSYAPIYCRRVSAQMVTFYFKNLTLAKNCYEELTKSEYKVKYALTDYTTLVEDLMRLVEREVKTDDGVDMKKIFIDKEPPMTLIDVGTVVEKEQTGQNNTAKGSRGLKTTSRSCSNLINLEVESRVSSKALFTPAPPTRPPPPISPAETNSIKPDQRRPPNPPPRVNPGERVIPDTEASIDGPLITITVPTTDRLPPLRPDPPPRAVEQPNAPPIPASPMRIPPAVPPRPS